jgi:hypothetical protein
MFAEGGACSAIGDLYPWVDARPSCLPGLQHYPLGFEVARDKSWMTPLGQTYRPFGMPVGIQDDPPLWHEVREGFVSFASPADAGWSSGSEWFETQDVFVSELPFTSHLVQAPAESRYMHGLLRNASECDIDLAAQRLEAEAESLSDGQIVELLHWLDGAGPHRQTDDHVHRRRVRECVLKLRTIVEKVDAAGCRFVLRRLSAQRVRDMLGNVLRQRRYERRRLPAAPARLPSCAAAASDLASVIMRHGPPGSPVDWQSPPGVSVCR